MISILIPAYNEEITIKDTILDFHNVLNEAEIIVIDNNSTDNTSIIANSTFSEYNINGKVIFELKKGKSNAIRNAFRNINSDIYVMVDADTTYKAQDLIKLLQPVVDAKADMVVGDRLSNGQYKKQNKRDFHEFGNNLIKFIINKVFSSNRTDILSGYRVFTKRFVKTFPVMSSGFELETELTIHSLDKRLNVIEIPVQYKDRPIGSKSKLNTYKDGFKVIYISVNLVRLYRPLLFYSFFFIFTSLLGIIIGTIPVLEFINTARISHFPAAILASALITCSLVILAVALILDNITYQNKCNFEITYNKFEIK